MAEEIDVVVIGGGQAGLATSHELSERGVEHVVLEGATPGSSWGTRWDSFTIVAPNHSIVLPGAPYSGDAPDAFMGKAEMVAHLERYAAGLTAEVRTGMPVRALSRARGGPDYVLDTDDGTIRSRVVVVATGAYQKPYLPAVLAGLPEGTTCVDVSGYRNPGALPDGAVLVVGSGQSACQIAEELVLSGRDVVMACGRAPWFPRRPAGRDIFDWLLDSSFFEQRPEDLPTPAARHGANIQASGLGGGHDLHYRTLAELGVRLGGHVGGVDGSTVGLAPDLPDTLAFADAGYRRIRELIVEGCRSTGREVPEMPEPAPLTVVPVDEVPLRGLGTVVVATGFRSRYTEWIDIPGIVDELGFPVHVDGESAVSPGLHFVGVHFLRRRRSSLLFGVGDDAAATADLIASRRSLAS